MSDFDSKVLTMRSGKGDAVQHIYEVYRGNDGFLYLVANNIPNKADAIYLQGGKGSDGFGGATLDFNISHGDKLRLSGAWKISADRLFASTGIDVRDKYMGRIVIGLERGKTETPYRTIVKDVVYQEDWGIGLFAWDRAISIGIEWANKLNKRVFVYSESLGGATSGYRDPTNQPKSEG